MSSLNIIHCLQADYGIEVASLQFLPLGADLNASVYKAEARDKRRYFIKLKRHYNHAISLAITKLFYDAGLQQVILPIKTLHGRDTCAIDSFTLIVYPFIEGEDGFKRELTEDQWFILGKALRQIHEIQLPPHLQNQILKESYSDRWRQAVRSFLMQEALAQDEVGRQLVEFMKEKSGTIQRLVERAEELGQQVKEQKIQYVLCHADIHGGNVLIDENNALYIIDWDEPLMAPKERDLMFIGGGVANVWNKSHEEEFFYKGYGATEVNKQILAYYRHERIVVDIVEYYQELILSPERGGDKPLMYQQFIGMFAPQGVVEIAFKTH